MNAHMIRLTIPFVVGMVVANHCISSLSITTLFIITCALTALLFFLISQPKNAPRHPRFGIVAMATAFCIGMTLFTHRHNTVSSGVPNDTTCVIGTLAEQPQSKPRSTQLIITQANGIDIMLHVGKDKYSKEKRMKDSLLLSSLNVGDTIFARIKHLSPTAEASGEYGYYHKYLFNNGICATAYVPPHKWETHPCATTPSLLAKLHSLQSSLHDIYISHGIDGESAAVIEAMTIGRRTEISKDIRTNFAKSGASHVLALSGFHVSTILIILQLLFFTKFVPYDKQWIANACIIIALWLFAIIAGSSPSLIRATIMCTILLLCQSFSHKLLSLNSVIITLMLMLCYNPLNLFNVGFQLSFASVFGICAFSSDLSRLCPAKNRIANYIWQIITISFICSIITAPLVAYHFGRIPLYAIITNLAITLIVTLIIFTNALWWATLWLPSLTSCLTTILLFSANTMNAIVEWIASLPHSTLEWHPSVIGVVLSYTLIALIHTITKKKTSRI